MSDIFDQAADFNGGDIFDQIDLKNLPSAEDFQAAHRAHLDSLFPNRNQPAQQPAPATSPNSMPAQTKPAPSVWDRVKALASSTPAMLEGTLNKTTELANTPVVPESVVPYQQPQTILQGIIHGTAEFARGLTSPENIGMLGTGGILSAVGKVAPLLPRAISAGFGFSMLKDAYNRIPDVRDAINKQDWPAAAQAITEGVLSAGMGTAAAAHAVRGPRAGEAPPQATPSDRAVESARAGVEALTPEEQTPVQEAPGQGDIFDRGANAPASSGDIFDQVAAGAPSGDIFDRAAEQAQPQEQPSSSAGTSVDTTRGSRNVPLSDQGRQEAAQLANRTAGQFDRIESSTMDRALETANRVAGSNPEAGDVVPNEKLTPWYMGGHEGQPTDQVIDQINGRIRNNPDEIPAGQAPDSTKPPQSFNDFKHDVLSDLQDTVDNYQPGEKILKVTHGRVVQLVRAAAANGFPADESIDTDLMTSPWLSKPGEMVRLDPDTMKLADAPDASDPGIYYARHGATADNGENRAGSSGPGSTLGQRSLASTSAQPKPLWEMSPDELVAAASEARNRDKTDLEDLFGADGAQRYKRLERVANSTLKSNQETSAASDELARMEASLTDQQRNRLFGIGDDRPQLEDVRSYQQALGRLDFNSPQALGDSLKWAVTGVGENDNPADMTADQRVRYAQLRHGMTEAQRLGWDPVEVSQAALSGAAGRFKSPEDAAFMLRKFARSEAAEPESRPPVDTPALELRPPETQPAYGRETAVLVPGETTRYPVRYSVRDLADLDASHNPHSFEANPDYEYANDRDYSRTGNAARVVKQSAPGTFNSEFPTRTRLQPSMARRLWMPTATCSAVTAAP